MILNSAQPVDLRQPEVLERQTDIPDIHRATEQEQSSKMQKQALSAADKEVRQEAEPTITETEAAKPINATLPEENRGFRFMSPAKTILVGTLFATAAGALAASFIRPHIPIVQPNYQVTPLNNITAPYCYPWEGPTPADQRETTECPFLEPFSPFGKFFEDFFNSMDEAENLEQAAAASSAEQTTESPLPRMMIAPPPKEGTSTQTPLESQVTRQTQAEISSPQPEDASLNDSAKSTVAEEILPKDLSYPPSEEASETTAQTNLPPFNDFLKGYADSLSKAGTLKPEDVPSVPKQNTQAPLPLMIAPPPKEGTSTEAPLDSQLTSQTQAENSSLQPEETALNDFTGSVVAEETLPTDSSSTQATNVTSPVMSSSDTPVEMRPSPAPPPPPVTSSVMSSSDTLPKISSPSEPPSLEKQEEVIEEQIRLSSQSTVPRYIASLLLPLALFYNAVVKRYNAVVKRPLVMTTEEERREKALDNFIQERNLPKILDLAHKWGNEGNLEKVFDCYIRALKNRIPIPPAFLIYLGEQFQEEKRLGRALECYYCATIAPSSIEKLRQERESAALLFNKCAVLIEKKGNPENLITLGKIYYAKGDLKNAKNSYDKAYTEVLKKPMLFFSEKQVLSTLGDCYSKIETSLDKALTCYTKALDISKIDLLGSRLLEGSPSVSHFKLAKRCFELAESGQKKNELLAKCNQLAVENLELALKQINTQDRLHFAYQARDFFFVAENGKSLYEMAEEISRWSPYESDELDRPIIALAFSCYIKAAQLHSIDAEGVINFLQTEGNAEEQVILMDEYLIDAGYNVIDENPAQALDLFLRADHHIRGIVDVANKYLLKGDFEAVLKCYRTAGKIGLHLPPRILIELDNRWAKSNKPDFANVYQKEVKKMCIAYGYFVLEKNPAEALQLFIQAGSRKGLLAVVKDYETRKDFEAVLHCFQTARQRGILLPPETLKRLALSPRLSQSLANGLKIEAEKIEKELLITQRIISRL